MLHVREAQKVFDHLDKDQTGVLNEADVVKKVEQQTGLKYESARYRMGHSSKESKKHASPKRLAALKKAGGGGMGAGGGNSSSSGSGTPGTSPVVPGGGGAGAGGGSEGRSSSLS